jgi:hypothetical protein
MKVRLTKRLANMIDGINLDGHVPGDVLTLPDREAQMLVAERWAIPERREQSGEPPGDERRRETPSGRPDQPHANPTTKPQRRSNDPDSQIRGACS